MKNASSLTSRIVAVFWSGLLAFAILAFRKLARVTKGAHRGGASRTFSYAANELAEQFAMR
jgi:hypothetical protein